MHVDVRGVQGGKKYEDYLTRIWKGREGKRRQEKEARGEKKVSNRRTE